MTTFAAGGSSLSEPVTKSHSGFLKTDGLLWLQVFPYPDIVI